MVSEPVAGGVRKKGEVTDLWMALDLLSVEPDDLESVERGSSGEGDIG